MRRGSKCGENPSSGFSLDVTVAAKGRVGQALGCLGGTSFRGVSCRWATKEKPGMRGRQRKRCVRCDTKHRRIMQEPALCQLKLVRLVLGQRVCAVSLTTADLGCSVRSEEAVRNGELGEPVNQDFVL